MAVDETRQRVYWYVNTGQTVGELGSALSFVYKLYSLDVGGLVAGENMSAPVERLTVDDVDQAAYVDVKVDCAGVVWLMDQTSISKWDPAGGGPKQVILTVASLDKPGTSNSPVCANIMALNSAGELVDSGVKGSCLINGFALDGTDKVYYTYSSASMRAIRRMNQDGTGEEVVYSDVFYEWASTGQRLYSLGVDRLHNQIYAVSSAQNSGSRPRTRPRGPAAH